jgi:hypothetical protein
MEDVTIKHRAHDGQTTTKTEPGGGVFYPLPEKGLKSPVWTYGTNERPIVIYTCPVSAIPIEVWSLYVLWVGFKRLAVLPMAGGLCDQPEIVVKAFLLFEDELIAATPPPKGKPRP